MTFDSDNEDQLSISQVDTNVPTIRSFTGGKNSSANDRSEENNKDQSLLKRFKILRNSQSSGNR